MTYDKKYQVWKFFSPLVISDECTTHELIAEKCTRISETCLETDNLSDVTVKKKWKIRSKNFFMRYGVLA